MPCCGLFGKHKKNKKHHGGGGRQPEPQAFAVRPVQQRVQNGQVAYHTGGGGGGMSQTQQYQSYGMGGGGGASYPAGGDPAEYATNRALARGAASAINGATQGKYSRYVDKGAVMAADKYTQHQQKQAEVKRQQGQQGLMQQEAEY